MDVDVRGLSWSGVPAWDELLVMVVMSGVMFLSLAVGALLTGMVYPETVVDFRGLVTWMVFGPPVALFVLNLWIGMEL